MNKTMYGMSSVGGCSRAIAASKLGHDPMPQSADDISRLNHYTRLEAVAANQISDLCYRVEQEFDGQCVLCHEKYGTERNGFHVEIESTLFTLIGHLDRRIMINGKLYPVEIKSLGKSSWSRFQKEQFGAFSGYAGQECCYLEAEKSPGIYWVMERDTGNSLRYIVNDFNSEIELDGFERITLPVTFAEIEDKINQIEIHVQEGTLPDGEESDSCWFCNYKYICVKAQSEEKGTIIIDRPDLTVAAEQYKKGLEFEKLGAEMKADGILVLLTHAKQNSIDKFRSGGVSFTYRGFKGGSYFNTGLFKSQNPKLYEQYLSPKKEFDDYSIRVLGKRGSDD